MHQMQTIAKNVSVAWCVRQSVARLCPAKTVKGMQARLAQEMLLDGDLDPLLRRKEKRGNVAYCTEYHRQRSSGLRGLSYVTYFWDPLYLENGES